MAHGTKTIPIPIELSSGSSAGVVVSADAVYDYRLEKTQESINLTTTGFNSRIQSIEALILTLGNLFSYEFVEVLPEASEQTMYKIYFVPIDDSDDSDLVEQWITFYGVIEDDDVHYTKSTTIGYYWKKVGNTAVDLSQYSTTEQVEELVRSTIEDAVSVIENSMLDLLVFNLLKNYPYAYLKNVSYNNTTESLISQYVDTNIKNTSSSDKPNYVSLKVSDSANSVMISSSPRYVGYITKSVPYPGATSIIVHNLIPGKKYFYKEGLYENTHTFSTELTRRFIYADNLRNIRDLGGIPVKGGGYIAFDKIFRGAEITGSRINASNTAKQDLKNLGLTLHLDLRDISEVTTLNPLNIDYHRVSFVKMTELSPLTTTKKDIIRSTFNKVANEVINGGKVYMHCILGYHRAGLLAAMIEGVLGVSESEIMKDYELSSFTSFSDMATINDSFFTSTYNVLKEEYNGSWLNLLLTCGVTEETINNFKKVMIVNSESEIYPWYYEVSYDELVNLRNSSLLIPGAKYRMIDYDTCDGSEEHVYSCSGETIEVDFRSDHHPFDLILTALSKNKLDNNVKAVHSARDTEGFFAEEDLAKWELKYDLDNDKSKYTWAINEDVITGYDEVEENGYRPDADIYYRIIFENETILVKPDTGPYHGVIIEVSEGSANYAVGNIVSLLATNVPGAEVEVLNESANSSQLSYERIYTFSRVPIYTNIHSKGIIYYMKDEHNNEVPYDFKNIRYRKYHNPTLPALYNMWVYTFNDTSHNVSIKPFIDDAGLHLNRNIFIGPAVNCYFDSNCHNNVIDGSAINCTFGKYNNYNNFKDLEDFVSGQDCTYNRFYDNASVVTMENNVYALLLHGNIKNVIVEERVWNRDITIDTPFKKVRSFITYTDV